MKKLLFAQYIDYANEKNRTTLIILNLLHELRVMTLSQMTEMINLDFRMNKSSVAQQISILAKAGFVEKIRFGKEMCYYLTKLGHQSIGGVYTIPKVPEYNLHHYLAINCYLIQVMRLLKDHPRLKRFVSERRQVYEAKDFNKENKGVKYFVADFQAVFKGEGVANEIIWYFEIELTMKTLRRYQTGRIQTRNFENQQGQKIYVTEVVVEEFQLLESKEVTQSRQQARHTQQGQGAQPASPAQPGNMDANYPLGGQDMDISDDDMPF